MKTPTVTVVVPTLRRPAPLRRALASLFAQETPPGATLEIVVVDNSSDGDARAAVAAAAAGAPWPVRYLGETRPGVANARNCGVAAARGVWVAFLDDDEEASPTWIARHLATADEAQADAVFGPVSPRAEDGAEIGPFAPYFSRRFDLPDGVDITDRAAYLGTNNSMFHRERCLAGPSPFDPRLNSVGGEDSLLLRNLAASGRRFIWSSRAGVTEWVPPRRLCWRYVRRRKFLSGQIRTFVHQMANPPSWSRVALWMAVGIVQTGVAAAMGAALWLVDRPRAQRSLATAWGGFGKIAWMTRFRPALYGEGLVS